jgi:hypothetical protein
LRKAQESIARRIPFAFKSRRQVSSGSLQKTHGIVFVDMSSMPSRIYASDWRFEMFELTPSLASKRMKISQLESKDPQNYEFWSRIGKVFFQRLPISIFVYLMRRIGLSDMLENNRLLFIKRCKPAF